MQQRNNNPRSTPDDNEKAAFHKKKGNSTLERSNSRARAAAKKIATIPSSNTPAERQGQQSQHREQTAGTPRRGKASRDSKKRKKRAHT